ncbi:MAG: hypothetical protein AAF228_00565 [Pseudomonadota bacterium]
MKEEIAMAYAGNVSTRFDSNFIANDEAEGLRDKLETKTSWRSILNQVYDGPIDEASAEKARFLLNRMLSGIQDDGAPTLKFKSDFDMNGAHGGYSKENNTIYINENLRANPDKMSEVLMEEIGHFVEAKLEIQDTPWDEGELFQDIVSGEATADDLTYSKKLQLYKDDHGFVFDEGTWVAVENSSTPSSQNLYDLFFQQHSGNNVDNAYISSFNLGTQESYPTQFPLNTVLKSASDSNNDGIADYFVAIVELGNASFAAVRIDTLKKAHSVIPLPDELTFSSNTGSFSFDSSSGAILATSNERGPWNEINLTLTEDGDVKIMRHNQFTNEMEPEWTWEPGPSPEFNSPDFVTIAENLIGGDHVYQTFATYSGEETLTYSLADDAGGMFEVDSETGEVALAEGQSLDHATQETHIITIEISDGTSTTIQDVTVIVREPDSKATLFVDDKLHIGESIYSQNGRYELKYETNGFLKIYDKTQLDSSENYVTVSSVNTSAVGGYLELNDDGGFRIYRADSTASSGYSLVSSSGTENSGMTPRGDFFFIIDDETGALELHDTLYDTDESPSLLWSSADKPTTISEGFIREAENPFSGINLGERLTIPSQDSDDPNNGVLFAGDGTFLEYTDDNDGDGQDDLHYKATFLKGGRFIVYDVLNQTIVETLDTGAVNGALVMHSDGELAAYTDIAPGSRTEVLEAIRFKTPTWLSDSGGGKGVDRPTDFKLNLTENGLQLFDAYIHDTRPDDNSVLWEIGSSEPTQKALIGNKVTSGNALTAGDFIMSHNGLHMVRFGTGYDENVSEAVNDDGNLVYYSRSSVDDEWVRGWDLGSSNYIDGVHGGQFEVGYDGTLVQKDEMGKIINTFGSRRDDGGVHREFSLLMGDDGTLKLKDLEHSTHQYLNNANPGVIWRIQSDGTMTDPEKAPPPLLGNSLTNGRMTHNTSLISDNGQYEFKLDNGVKLIDTTANEVIWSEDIPASNNANNAYLEVFGTGKMEYFDGDGNSVWHTDTEGVGVTTGLKKLKVHDDGHITLTEIDPLDDSEVTLWEIDTSGAETTHQRATTSEISVATNYISSQEGALKLGQSLWSNNGKYQVTLLNDGLHIYEINDDGSKSDIEQVASQIGKGQKSQIRIGDDGSLIFTDNEGTDTEVVSSDTAESQSHNHYYRMIIRDDGVLYTEAGNTGTTVWSSEAGHFHELTETAHVTHTKKNWIQRAVERGLHYLTDKIEDFEHDLVLEIQETFGGYTDIGLGFIDEILSLHDQYGELEALTIELLMDMVPELGIPAKTVATAEEAAKVASDLVSFTTETISSTRYMLQMAKFVKPFLEGGDDAKELFAQLMTETFINAGGEDALQLAAEASTLIENGSFDPEDVQRRTSTADSLTEWLTNRPELRLDIGFDIKFTLRKMLNGYQVPGEFGGNKAGPASIKLKPVSDGPFQTFRQFFKPKQISLSDSIQNRNVATVPIERPKENGEIEYYSELRIRFFDVAGVNMLFNPQLKELLKLSLNAGQVSTHELIIPMTIDKKHTNGESPLRFINNTGNIRIEDVKWRSATGAISVGTLDGSEFVFAPVKAGKEGVKNGVAKIRQMWSGEGDVTEDADSVTNALHASANGVIELTNGAGQNFDETVNSSVIKAQNRVRESISTDNTLKYSKEDISFFDFIVQHLHENNFPETVKTSTDSQSFVDSVLDTTKQKVEIKGYEIDDPTLRNLLDKYHSYTTDVVAELEPTFLNSTIDERYGLIKKANASTNSAHAFIKNKNSFSVSKTLNTEPVVALTRSHVYNLSAMKRTNDSLWMTPFGAEIAGAGIGALTASFIDHYLFEDKGYISAMHAGASTGNLIADEVAANVLNSDENEFVKINFNFTGWLAFLPITLGTTFEETELLYSTFNPLAYFPGPTNKKADVMLDVRPRIQFNFNIFDLINGAHQAVEG